MTPNRSLYIISAGLVGWECWSAWGFTALESVGVMLAMAASALALSVLSGRARVKRGTDRS